MESLRFCASQPSSRNPTLLGLVLGHSTRPLNFKDSLGMERCALTPDLRMKDRLKSATGATGNRPGTLEASVTDGVGTSLAAALPSDYRTLLHLRSSVLGTRTFDTRAVNVPARPAWLSLADPAFDGSQAARSASGLSKLCIRPRDTGTFPSPLGSGQCLGSSTGQSIRGMSRSALRQFRVAEVGVGVFDCFNLGLVNTGQGTGAQKVTDEGLVVHETLEGWIERDARLDDGHGK